MTVDLQEYEPYHHDQRRRNYRRDDDGDGRGDGRLIRGARKTDLMITTIEISEDTVDLEALESDTIVSRIHDKQGPTCTDRQYISRRTSYLELSSPLAPILLLYLSTGKSLQS